MFPNLSEDIRAFCENRPSFKKIVYLFFASTDFKAVLYYRFSSWLYKKRMVFLAHYVRYVAKKKYSVEISPIARIGPGFRLVHSLGTVIGNGAKFGDHCTVYQQVTIGTVNVQKGDTGYPEIGNHVILYAGAKVLGNITIGDYAIAAAGAVVIRDVEPHAVVAGIPAKQVK